MIAAMKHFRTGLVLLYVLAVLALYACAHSPRMPDSGGSSVAASDFHIDPPSDPDADTDGSSGPKADAVSSEPEADTVSSKPGTDTVSSEPKADTHTHVFTGATCTEPGRCECGAAGVALEHNYTGATCTNAGTCTRCGAKGSALGHDFAAATCTAPKTCKRCKTTSGSALGHSYSSGKCTKCGDKNGPLTPEEAKLFKNKLSDEENAQALAVAREIVKQIGQELPDSSDFDRIARAAELVSAEYQKGGHVEKGNYYHQAYGVFVKRESSCAGCCRALGLVLSCMGYKWTHVNENQWKHQWVTVNIDGETVWVDGQVGWIGTGRHPADYD